MLEAYAFVPRGEAGRAVRSPIPGSVDSPVIRRIAPNADCPGRAGRRRQREAAG
jgi:hypothetical protein